MLPVRWTAPETLATMKYTAASDVWAFGITTYEILTNGGTPYTNMSTPAVVSGVEEGYRMVKPVECPPEVYDMVLSCWESVPANRPTAAALCDFFQRDAAARGTDGVPKPIGGVVVGEGGSTAVQLHPGTTIYRPGAATPARATTQLDVAISRRVSPTTTAQPPVASSASHTDGDEYVVTLWHPAVLCASACDAPGGFCFKFERVRT
jgi:serine/threonine protein kinase